MSLTKAVLTRGYSPILTAIATVAMLASAAGCGGGGDDTASAGGQSAANGTSAGGDSARGVAGGGQQAVLASYIKEADDVCRRWSIRIRADVQREFKGDLNGSAKEVEAAVDSMVSALKTHVIGEFIAEITGIQDLETPPEAKNASAAAVAAVRELIRLAKADPEGFVLSGKGVPEAEAIAEKQGFTVCGSVVVRP
jgi:hypothetical protein